MSRPKMRPKPGDVVCTPNHILETVNTVDGDYVEVTFYEKSAGYYKLERYHVRDLRKVHYLTTE